MQKVVEMRAARTNTTFIDTHACYEAFWEGFIDYQSGQHQNPYVDLQHQVEAQAWGSGREAAVRTTAIGRARHRAV